MQPLQAAISLFALTITASCSMQQLVVDRIGDALSNGGGAYAADPDVELVGAAIPFGLKLTESLIAESPQHRGLLLSAARGFTQYAYVYVEMPADENEERDLAAAYAARERARRLYLRARDYGLRGLDAAHPGFATTIHSDPSAALARTTSDDVALLHWTAVAWAAAISLGKDDAAMLAGLAPMRQMAQRALALDEKYAEGAIHTLHMSLAMAAPLPDAQRLAEAKSHFTRALELSAGRQAAPYVTYAESICVPFGRREEFDGMLALALRIDGPTAPETRLANEVFQRRARWLLAHADRYFSN